MLEAFFLLTARGIVSARALFSSARVDDGLVETSVATKAPATKLTLLLANSPDVEAQRVIDSRSFVSEAPELSISRVIDSRSFVSEPPELQPALAQIDSRSFVSEAPELQPALAQRYATGSSVFMTRRNGEETFAYVKEYDAVKQVYTLELEQRGSSNLNLEECDETSLREPNMLEAFLKSPMFFSTRAFSPARDDDGRYDA